MQVKRCPECGNRLTTNYCHLCMKRVSFFSQKGEDASSCHREEGHTCVSFEMPEEAPEKIRFPKVICTPGDSGRREKSERTGKKKLVSVAVVVAVLWVLSSVFGAMEYAFEEALEPEIHYEAFIQAGGAGAEDVPGIVSVEIYNANDIVITVDGAGLYYDDYAIAVTIENGSDQDITVSSNLLSVNGYMSTSSSLFEQVEEGQTDQAFLELYSYDLENAGIKQVAQVEFYLDIYDSDEYTDIDQTGLITLQTQVAGDYVQPVDDSGWELYNDGGVRMVVRGDTLSAYGDYTVTLFMENSTDYTVCLSDSRMLINGQETDGLLWTTMRPHTRAIDRLYFSDLEELGISDISQIEELTVDLTVEYMDDWETVETKTDTLTFTPAR